MSERNRERSIGKKSNDERAQANHERELREMVEDVEKRLSGSKPPQNESPHDFIERRMREIAKK
jgi:hypothetical protein